MKISYDAKLTPPSEVSFQNDGANLKVCVLRNAKPPRLPLASSQKELSLAAQ